MSLFQNQAEAALFTAIGCIAIYKIVLLITLIPSNKTFNKKRTIIYDCRRLLNIRALGVLFLGLIPLAMVLTWNFDVFKGIGLEDNPVYANWKPVPIFAALIILFVYFIFPKRSINQIRSLLKLKDLNAWLIFVNVISWALYLLGFEFLFRGLFLFSCEKLFGTTLAIIFNCIAYSLSYFPKSKEEALGVVPFGLILCAASLITGSFWAAWILHLLLALSIDYVILKRMRAIYQTNKL